SRTGDGDRLLDARPLPRARVRPQLPYASGSHRRHGRRLRRSDSGDQTRMTQRDHLRQIAVAAMRSRGLEPDMPRAAVAEAAAVQQPPRTSEESTRDLRSRLWCSIDNDDSRDLDQLSVAERLPGGTSRVLVAIADVAAAVSRSSPIDSHAAVNTTSVYTPAGVFSMLPDKLSTDPTAPV